MLIMLRSLTYGQQHQHGATAISQFAPFVERITESRKRFGRAARSSGTRTIESFDALDVRGVSFGYGDSPILGDVNLSLTRGQIVGIVGPSGSGKTTLVQLALGLLQPTSGEIRVDGIELGALDAEAWRRMVAYVPQDSRLLAGTVADNVRFMRPGVSDADVERALADANLRLDPSRFPQGAATDLETAGRELSGGQRQRLAIARALATSPSLLVLDEPTSALDAESEEVITETLARLRGRVTTIVVTHRESTLRVCDRVFGVEGQRVVERGRAD
jgi:ABC-type multidrug transport system fused ATPase/permease subunit